MKAPSNIFERSGKVVTDSLLVSFFYDLLRDHVLPGVLEKIVTSIEYVSDKGQIEHTLSNGWLALYAEDVAARLTPSDTEPVDLLSSLGVMADGWRGTASAVYQNDANGAAIYRKCADDLSVLVRGKPFDAEE